LQATIREPWLMETLYLLGAFAAGLLTEWLRQRPKRKRRKR